MAKSIRKNPVRKYHDRVATRYDASYDDVFWQWHDQLTWDQLKPHLPRDMSDRLLDLGCGTGKWAAKLIKSGYHVTCVDISARMLDTTRRKLENTGVADRAEFVHADLVDLSAIEERAYAFAVAFGEPIGCSSSPARAVKEIRKCLIPGGVLVATFDNKLAALDYYLESAARHDELPKFLKDGVTRWLTQDRDEQFPIHTHTPTQAVKLLEGAGFEILDIVGKTVLPMRHHREYLAEAKGRRFWAKMEKSLWRDRDAIGRAAHIQIAARAVEGLTGRRL